MFQNLVPQKLVPDILGLKKAKKIKGTVVLMKKNVLDRNSVGSSVFDRLSELLGQGVTIQLISAAHADSANGFKGKLGKPASLEGWITTLTYLKAGESAFTVRFELDGELGVPGAFLIRNNHLSEFFLVSLKLEDVPNQGDIHFVCNSWIYPSYKYKRDRIFFRNKSYIPSQTPEPLRKYREEELLSLRGDGTGERKEWERIYDYDVYNDLGNPDKGSERGRPILGGSSTFPYPRRGRTGRPATKSDPCSETRKGSFYIPKDENFGLLKNSEFLTYGLKSLTHGLGSRLGTLPLRDNEFDSFEDVRGLYNGRFKLPERILKAIRDNTHAPILREILRTDGERFLSFPLPQVIKENKSGWMSDEEFAREMLAGVNPCLICCLQEFPPRSKLDSKVYGNHTSTITKEHIEINLDGLTVDEAIDKKRLFILDHHDPVMPYLWRINTTTPSKTYATRTVLFLKEDGTLKPLAIELSSPPQNGDQFGKESEVHLPAEHGPDSVMWLLAKAYVCVNDSGYHQLISHWLNTHAVIEPFVIATNRHLSVLHPIHKLLLPHYRDTMNINALARKSLVNAGGIIESTFLWQRFSMEMSSIVYNNWVFPEQALPVDLIKRGMAVEDPASPHGLRLVIEDYPYAVDGLEIWFAIKIWVQDYCFYYYETDETVKNDSELQSWWKEVIEVGHGDKRAEPWWFKMQTREELIETCTIIIWIASALHAAVNFGQYPYGGYILNRPTLSRRFMPKRGTPEYDEFVKDPQKAYLKTITAKETLLDLSTIEILSRHTSDEVYLGQRDSDYWTSDAKALEAFSKFQKEIEEIGERIIKRNSDGKLKNRFGTVKMPYTVLFPTSEVGLTGKGIPNSISI